ncbi:MAG: hypothetical protein IKS28_00465 [Clostridia bacterium]|nr:hypothetical protein [Clostridia bacterium]
MNQDLKTSLELGAKNVVNLVSKENHYRPYWSLEIDDDNRAFSHIGWVGHNFGRWWDAAMRLESTLPDFVIPAEIEAGMLNTAHEFFSQPDVLGFQPYPRSNAANEQEIELHSIREWILCLLALIKFRKNRWAAETAHRLCLTLDKIFRVPEMPPEPGSGDEYQYWDLSKLAYSKVNPTPKFNHGYPIFTFCRAMAPLCWLYEATGDEIMFDLANRFMEVEMRDIFMPDGTIRDVTPYRHMHSTCGAVEGLIAYGRMTGRRDVIERAYAAYKKELLPMVSRSGFCTHGISYYDAGDPASTADVAQIALWLFQEGYTEFADLPEHLLRCRVFPAQISEPFDPPLTAMEPDSTEEKFQNLNERCIGGFNIYLHPTGGKGNTTDVTCSCMHSLVELYRHAVTDRGAFYEIFLHFDRDESGLRVRVRYDDAAEVRISTDKPKAVHIRVPEWAKKVRFEVDGNEITPLRCGIWAHIPPQVSGAQIVMRYDLPDETYEENVRNGETFVYLFKGDRIVGVKPNPYKRGFYETLE